MEASEALGAKRPGWVWAISIFFVVSAAWTLLSFYLIYSGAVPLNAAQEAYFDSLTGLDYFSMVVLAIVNISAAVSLFLLRKVAFYLFTYGLIANVFMTLWHMVSKDWAGAIGGAGLVGAAFGLGSVAIVCVYSWRLIQRHVLR